MPELAFRDGVMDRIRLKESRYDEQAYLFVLSALEYSQSKLESRRHISAAELASSCRELVLLAPYRIQRRREEFADIFDFETAFVRDYPWNFAVNA